MGRVVILQGREAPHEIIDLNEIYNFYELSTSEEYIDKALKNAGEGGGRVIIAEYYNNKERLKALKSMLEMPLMRNIVIINQLSDDNPDNIFYP